MMNLARPKKIDGGRVRRGPEMPRKRASPKAESEYVFGQVRKLSKCCGPVNIGAGRRTFGERKEAEARTSRGVREEYAGSRFSFAGGTHQRTPHRLPKAFEMEDFNNFRAGQGPAMGVMSPSTPISVFPSPVAYAITTEPPAAAFEVSFTQ
jgi:hypothetical protein